MTVIENIIKTDTSVNILARKLSRMPNKLFPFIWVEMMRSLLILQQYTICDPIIPAS